MTRESLRALAAMVMACRWLGDAAQAQSGKQPNILVIWGEYPPRMQSFRFQHRRDDELADAEVIADTATLRDRPIASEQVVQG